MKINCVVCKEPKLDISLSELLSFVKWLEKEHTIPVCLECTDREIANLFLTAYASLSTPLQESEQELEEDEQEAAQVQEAVQEQYTFQEGEHEVILPF